MSQGRTFPIGTKPGRSVHWECRRPTVDRFLQEAALIRALAEARQADRNPGVRPDPVSACA